MTFDRRLAAALDVGTASSTRVSHSWAPSIFLRPSFYFVVPPPSPREARFLARLRAFVADRWVPCALFAPLLGALRLPDTAHGRLSASNI